MDYHASQCYARHSGVTSGERKSEGAELQHLGIDQPYPLEFLE